MSKPEIHTFEIPDPTGVGNPNNYAKFVDLYEYENLKVKADKLAEALKCEIKVVKHAGYNPHFSEKILKEYRGDK